MKSFITNRLRGLLPGLAGFLFFLFLWSLLAYRSSSLFFPTPGETVVALRRLALSGSLLENTLITVYRTMLGFSLAFVLGTLAAVLTFRIRFLAGLFRPLLSIVQTTPPVVWAALAVIWFGIAEDLTPVFLIFIVTFPLVTVNIYEGLGSIDGGLLEMAALYHCRRWQILFGIYLPALSPAFFSSLRVGLAFAWKAAVFAEFIGSTSGIGYELSRANSALRTDNLFAWAIVLVGLMLAVEYLIIGPWKQIVLEWRNNE
ncbi:MAG: ABC transporter permease [Bacillota bacterium]